MHATCHLPTTLIPTALSLPELTAVLGTHFAQCQPLFLQNDGAPVLGILPAVSWTLRNDSTTNGIELQTKIRQDTLNYQQQNRRSDFDDYLKTLQSYIDNFNQSSQKPLPTQTDSPTSAKAEYQQGLMGFVGYDIAAHTLNAAIGIDARSPAAFFGHYDVTLSAVAGGVALRAPQAILLKIEQKLTEILQNPPPKAAPIDLQAVWQKADYQRAFACVQQYLHAGDAYQINLTQPWQAASAPLVPHLPTLTQTGAPFSGYVASDGFELLSVSPELFFTFYQENGKSHIITKPIKGTRPRHSDAATDRQLADELATSKKDIAENLMIVDLLRNDLGKYAATGGVRVPVRFAVESFHNVHHLVSTISATLDDAQPLAVLFGSLPAGSITGAPKKRACEIIHELEAMPRGAYCGSMGFLNFNGTGQFNVLIRSIYHDGQMVRAWAGGGVTVGSNCDDEYQECLDKIGTILSILRQGEKAN